MTRFGDQIGLVRADVGRGPLRPGECLDFTLYWSPLPSYKPGPHEAILILRNDKGDRIWQESSLLGHDLFPLEQWQPGEVLREKHRIYLPDRVPTGEYDLLVRVRKHGQGVCLTCDRSLDARNRRDYRVAGIAVAEPEPLSGEQRIPRLVGLLRR